MVGAYTSGTLSIAYHRKGMDCNIITLEHGQYAHGGLTLATQAAAYYLTLMFAPRCRCSRTEMPGRDDRGWVDTL